MTDGTTGITATQIYALSWQALRAPHDLGDDDLARVTIAHRGHACANPKAHLPRHHTTEEIAASPLIASPYRRLHCSPLSDGAAAVILAAPDALPTARRQRRASWGWGRRPIAPLPSARTPAPSRPRPGRCKRLAGWLMSPPPMWAWPKSMTPMPGPRCRGFRRWAYRTAGAGFADGHFAVDGALPVNLSGGLLGQGAALARPGWRRSRPVPSSSKAAIRARLPPACHALRWPHRTAASAPTRQSLSLCRQRRHETHLTLDYTLARVFSRLTSTGCARAKRGLVAVQRLGRGALPPEPVCPVGRLTRKWSCCQGGFGPLAHVWKRR